MLPGITRTQLDALKTIVQTLQRQSIPFQVSGGLAAKFYGSSRPLYDIDLDIKRKDISAVRTLFLSYITRDWYHYQDGRHDCWLLTLSINGIPVDIAQNEDYVMIAPDGHRVTFESDLSKASTFTIDGITVPVESKEELLTYKKLVQRPEDLADIAAIST